MIGSMTIKPNKTGRQMPDTAVDSGRASRKSRVLPLALSVGAALLLSACNLAPEHQRPALAVPTQVSPANASPSASTGDWDMAQLAPHMVCITTNISP